MTSLIEDAKTPDPPPRPVIAKLSIHTARLAPCTELIYSAQQLNPLWASGARTVKFTPRASYVNRLDGARFVDRDGRGWVRYTGTGLLRSEALDPPDEPRRDWENELVDKPVVKKAASCGAVE
ncbi:hypothetical protein ACFWFU_05255 [Streptomyces sp. NPDC060235]|uniref:hypothetical protein n=1 Tax=Streptomyces sp. NPDC060235 TaxID=3347080 RepID=UPI003648BE03